MSKAYVYKFTSPSGKIYIGLTSANIDKRWKQHITLWKKLKKNKIEYRGAAATPILFYAFDKYDPSLWEKEILIETDDLDYAKEQEIKLIEFYQATNSDFGYNVLIGGQTGWAGKNLSEEHKNNQGQSRKKWYETPDGQEWKNELSNRWSGNNNPVAVNGHPWLGRKHTEESKEKNRQAHLGKPSGRKGTKLPQEHCDNISKAKKGKPIHPNTREAARKSRLGKPQTETQKKAVTEANSLRWLVTFPTGEQREIVNLRQFCKEHKLSQGNLVTSGKTKGYKARKLES